MWWDGDIPTASPGNDEKSGSWLLLIVVILFCLGLGVGLMMIGHDLFGAKPTPTPPSENDQ